ncbi:MAG: hypothetical protein DRH08_05700 [Deltaproteobacteria bacterium]|nr:MAG: hypothetical protein DRH08_05700 [Deltaproteobacteria bacterium]
MKEEQRKLQDKTRKRLRQLRKAEKRHDTAEAEFEIAKTKMRYRRAQWQVAQRAFNEYEQDNLGRRP